jgi:ferric-dicitrate binding protein FerR (iron transport regulator)
MQHAPEINDEMLVKYLAGEATVPETQAVMDWARHSEENHKKLDDFRMLWHTETPEDHEDFDTETAWKNVKAQTLVSPFSIRKLLPSVGKAAAAVALLAAGTWFVMQKLRKPEIQWVQISTQDHVDSLKLEDGSKVVLKAGSQVEYPRGFAKDERIVKMTGTAYFDVARDEKRPFEVLIGNEVSVRVLGTSFKVHQTDSLITVWVKSGKVEMSGLSGKIQLDAGEEGRYYTDKHLLVERNKYEGNELAFIKGCLDFRNTPLTEVAHDLSEWYDVDVQVANSSVGRCRITTRFSKENFETTLAVIVKTLNLTQEKRGNTIYLNGAGCP